MLHEVRTRLLRALLSDVPGAARAVAGFLWTRMGTTTQFISLLARPTALSVLAKREAGCYQFSCGDDEARGARTRAGANAGCGTAPTRRGVRQLASARLRARARARPRRVCVKPCVWVASGVRAKPTSIISAVGTVSGLVCAASMPIFGAIVDYTSKRWELGRGMAASSRARSSRSRVAIDLAHDDPGAATIGVRAYMAPRARPVARPARSRRAPTRGAPARRCLSSHARRRDHVSLVQPTSPK